MGEFDKTIERIRLQEARTDHINECLRKFREAWLNDLVNDVNKILALSGKKIKEKVSISATGTNKSKFISKGKRLIPIIPSTIGDIGDVQTLSDNLLKISETEPDLIYSDTKGHWRSIIEILKKYISKYDNEYERDIRSLIGKSDPNRIQMLEENRESIKDIQEDETQRIGAINRLHNNEAIVVKIKNGKIREIEIGNSSPSRNKHITRSFWVEYLSYEIENNSLRNRFFDDDDIEYSELKFFSGKVYNELNRIVIETLNIFDTFKNNKGDGTINTMIIDLIEPLYRYIKRIEPRSLPTFKLVIKIFNLQIDPNIILNKIDKRI